MKKIILTACALALGLTVGCAGSSGAGYQSISPKEAKARMAEGAVVVDVREKAEYDAGHVPGAQLLPLGTVDGKTAAAVIPDKGTEVLVYCRTGVRSKKGAEKLADLGYTNVSEFGGIVEWPYEVVRTAEGDKA